MTRTANDAEVRRHLENVLGSQEFLRSQRHSSVLRHLVEQTLAGKADRLREYDLGVDCFGRGEQFDPRTDTIVRVELTRLRNRLEKYYAGQGGQDRWRIELHRGSYVPIFTPSAASSPGVAPGTVAAPRAWPASWRYGGWALLMIASATGIVGFRAGRRSPIQGGSPQP